MGQVEHPLWKRWAAFRNACSNPNNNNYPYYGGRGIDYAPRWDSFVKFVTDVEEEIGPMPSPDHILERIDNDRGYHPGNIKWATIKENHNNRRSNQLLSYDGRTQSISAWEAETGLAAATIWSRIFDYNWSIEDALKLPPYQRRK